MERIMITGGAGFIGSHLAKKLLEMGHNVICIDNLELGNEHHLEDLKSYEGFEFVVGDVSDVDALDKMMCEKKIQRVFHLAANSDIRKSSINPGIDLRNTFLTTYSVLEAMRRNGVKKLFFSSTSAIYGDHSGTPVAENEGGLAPISYYGSGKLASEAFISSYSYMNDIDVLVFRFPNVIGPKLTHGVIFDFIRKLKKNPNELEILGDGTQRKPYIHVRDLVDAITDFSFRNGKGVNIYNIGVLDSTSVNEIADMVCERMGLKNVIYKYTGGSTGWKGDVGKFQYNLGKMISAGWKPRLTSNESVKQTLMDLNIDEI